MILSKQQSQLCDQIAAEQHQISGQQLMRTAGERLADHCLNTYSEGSFLFFCGPGNNGGDGYVAADRLARLGFATTVARVADVDRYSGDAKWARDIYLQHGGGERELYDPAVDASKLDVKVAVDCILGTGSSGQLYGNVLKAVEILHDMQRAGTLIVSCDLPTGVDYDEGTVVEQAVKADLTVALNTAGPANWINPGKRYCGQTVVADIGLPKLCNQLVSEQESIKLELLDPLAAKLPPRKSSVSNKFTAGHAVVVAGSQGMHGSASLSVSAAWAAGTGYVSLYSPDLGGSRSAEPETVLLPDQLSIGSALKKGRSSLLIGPGMGRSEASSQLWRDLQPSIESGVPWVLDADGLWHLGSLEQLNRLKRNSGVLTPHSGELARLLGVSSSEIESGRLAAVRKAAQVSQQVVVLKGDDTLLAEPDGYVWISPGGAENLASAGMGDVLAGLLCGLLTLTDSVVEAARWAVELQLRTAWAAAQQGAKQSLLPTKLVCLLANEVNVCSSQ